MAIKNKYKLNAWNEYYEKEKKIHLKHRAGFFSSYDIYLCESILKKFLQQKNSLLSLGRQLMGQESESDSAKFYQSVPILFLNHVVSLRLLGTEPCLNYP